ADKGKLDYAKQAARDLVGMLSGSDILGIVQYDDRVEPLWPSAPLENREPIRRAIAALTPGGSTNLAGGMLEGGRQVLHNRFGGIRRVLLLSDGLANVGVTDRAAIARMAASLRHQGVQISALGLGLDYDENLMQAIAESGGGNYYYIEHPSQVSRIFTEEMGILSSLVTRDFVLSFHWGDSVRGVRVLGYPTSHQERRTTVNMTDFHAGEERTLLLQLDLAAAPPGSQSLGSFHLGYRDPAQGKRHELSRPVAVERVREPERVARSENRGAAVESRLIAADHEHEEAVRLFEQGDAPAARARMAAMDQALQRDLGRYQDVKLRKKLEAVQLEAGAIAQAENDGDTRKGYLKQRKADFYRSQQGKRDGYLMQVGAKGEKVKDLQRALKGKGFYDGEENGVYDEQLRRAVAAFQKAAGFPEDGIAGPRTLNRLGLY
ncbi:MAG: peptidoglycan-binding protein, partial [Deltaproteobacteria bacterium]|nr:peptidoglycan-binding protein [Deltaproteobacteria bacterium]